MDATGKLKTTDVEEVSKLSDSEEVTDWMKKMVVTMHFSLACVVISGGPPDTAQDRHKDVLYRVMVVSSLMSIFTSGSLAILVGNELPTKKRAWMRIFKVMVVITGTSFMLAATLSTGFCLRL